MTSYGYIRQSRRADLDVALSADAQLAAIRRLAARYGDDPEQLVILSDMGRSGAQSKTHLRTSYLQLIDAIKGNGHGTTIYAISMSRLARSLNELFSIFTLASEHGVRIVFEKEGEVRFDTPIGKLHATITGAVYEFERELAVERTRDNVAVRRARGDRMGRIPYGSKEGESPTAVVDAYKEAGSLNGAAVILNRKKIKSWSGRPWTPNGVQSVISRIDPHLVKRNPAKQGAKRGSGSFLLYRLLRCPCGTLMTGYHNREYVYYRCHRSDGNADHPRYGVVSERKMLPLFKEEVGDITNLVFALDKPLDIERHTALTEKRSRVVEAFLDGVISKDERTTHLESIDAELASLMTTETVIAVPDWDDDPKVVNEFLKGLFGEVSLDEHLAPIFDWKIDVRALRDRVPTQSLVRIAKTN